MKEKIFSYRKDGDGWAVLHNGQPLGRVYKSKDYAGACWIALTPAGVRPGETFQTWLTREDAATALLPRRDWSWAHNYRYQ